MNKIIRPSIVVLELNNGRCTYEVSASGWQNVYRRRRTGTKKDITSLANKFEKSYDKEAAMIETEEVSPHYIMGDLVANGLFTRIRKLPDGFTC